MSTYLLSVLARMNEAQRLERARLASDQRYRRAVQIVQQRMTPDGKRVSA